MEKLLIGMILLCVLIFGGMSAYGAFAKVKVMEDKAKVLRAECVGYANNPMSAIPAKCISFWAKQ